MLIAVQIMQGNELFLFAGILILSTTLCCAKRFFKMLRRTRWILISLFLIYSYASTGNPIWPNLGAFSPVDSGVTNGLLQITRLIMILAGLSILLASLKQVELISGMYTLLYPLRFFGISRERVAVRLALTLQYAENAMLKKDTKWQAMIEQSLKPDEASEGIVELKVSQLCFGDWLLIATSTAVIFGMSL
jgi:energy-coupling factor transport system permease protein